MSYNTFGSGTLKLKKNAKIPKDVLNKLSIDFDEIADSPDGGLWLTKEYSRDIDVDGAMNKLAPFVESGKVTMTGEDDEHWQYVFKDGKVYYQTGKVEYKQTKRTFNVNYIDPENMEDQTQFDIEDADFVTMFNDLVGLFGRFCAENYDDDPCWIMDIEEVPYDGEEE